MGRGRSPLSRRWRVALAAIVPAAFLATFFAWPISAVVDRGLRPDGQLDLTAFLDTASDPQTWSVLRFTLWQALLSTAVTLALGLPIAHVLSRFEFRGSRLARSVAVVPFVLPTVVVASAFAALLGPSGPVSWLSEIAIGDSIDMRHSLTAIVLAHGFFNVAVVVRTVGSVWERLDPGLAESARVLGAGRLRSRLEVELPLLMPAILSAASITFLFSASSFAVILILGGPTRATIEVEIWRNATRMLDLGVAAALSVLQLVAVFLLLTVTTLLERRSRWALPMVERAGVAKPVRGWARAWVGAVLAIAGLFLLLPPATMLQRSLTGPSGLTLDAWRALGGSLRDSILFVPPAEAVFTSLVTAAVATAISVPMGLLLALVLSSRRGRFAEAAVLLPLGTSAVTVGLGMMMAFSGPPLDIRAEAWLIPVAHSVVAIPFVVRVVMPVIRGIDPALREAAAVLGASPARVVREVDLRMMTAATRTAAGFAFAISLGEFGATTFLSRARTPTVPILIERLLGQPGTTNVAQAMALSCLLGLLVLIAVLVTDSRRGRMTGW